MIGWDAERVAAAAGVRLAAPAAGMPGPRRTVIDSRGVAPGDLFVGLPGEHVDGGTFAAQALEGGAWGVLVAEAHASGLSGGAVLAAEDPVAALGRLARGWRRALGAQVIAVTGSVGKTSTKDLIAAMVRPHVPTVASRANFNTEIGLPLEILAAPAGTAMLVLELGMRGFGQIAELTSICEPDVGVITTLAPVHLEQVGSLEGVARAKGELFAGMRDGTTAVLPAGEPLLAPWLRAELETLTFGPDGDVDYEHLDGTHVRVRVREAVLALELPFTSAHNRRNALAAVAAAVAAGVTPEGRVDAAFGALRGEHVTLPSGAVVINDCYNANPLSMRAALDDLASQDARGRRVAVLGDMLELGPDEAALHRAVGAHAAEVGVDVLIAVGRRAAAMAETFGGEVRLARDAADAAAVTAAVLGPGDVALVKASRGMGLEAVAEALAGAGTPG